MKLIVDNADRADAYLPVSWCIDEETKNLILRKEISDPQVLLVAASSRPDYYQKDEVIWDEESRKLIPLNYRTVYLTFNKPGAHRLFATILGYSNTTTSASNTTTSALYKKVMGAYEGKYVSRTGEFRPPEPFLGRAVVDIEVSEEFFAEEPPAWEKWYFGLWWQKDTTVDQCDWRQRRIFAYSFMPFFLLAWYIVRFAVGFIMYSFGFVAGVRNLYFRPVWAHRSCGLREIYSHRHTSLSNSIFWSDSADVAPRLWARAFHPFLLIPLSLIGWVVLYLSGLMPGPRSISTELVTVLKESWLTLLVFFGGSLTVALIVGVLFERALDWYDKRQSSKWNRELANDLKIAEKERLKKERARARRDRLLTQLSCETGGAGSLSTYQSIVLGFQGVKSKLCRPFRKA